MPDDTSSEAVYILSAAGVKICILVPFVSLADSAGNLSGGKTLLRNIFFFLSFSLSAKKLFLEEGDLNVFSSFRIAAVLAITMTEFENVFS